MTQIDLFSKAIGLEAPWYIVDIDFSPTDGMVAGEMNIYLDFVKGSRFLGSDGIGYTGYDTRPRKWQHLNFFQHTCYIHAHVPRLKLASGQTEMVEVPWAREGSHFTLQFEAFGMMLIRSEVTLSKVGEILGVNPGRVARFFNHWVTLAREGQNLKDLCSVGIDETSVKKGHEYVTLAVDLDTRKVIHVTPGKDKSTLGALKEHIITKNGLPLEVSMMSMDMSPAFIAGAAEHFPNAEVTFDRFHIVKLINEAMDHTRRMEQAACKPLKGTRYIWLRNEDTLNEEQLRARDYLKEAYPKIGSAYRLKLQFNTFWTSESTGQAQAFLQEWCKAALASELQPFIKVAGTVQRHLNGILSYITTGITNGILEGINSKVQLAKKRARGFRNIENFINMIYFLTADLKMPYPYHTA
jgi:transposase